MYNVLVWLARIIFQPQMGKIEGTNNLPKPPFILVLNHLTSYDPMLLVLQLLPHLPKRKIFFLTRKWVALLFAPFQKLLGMVPASFSNLAVCQDLLGKGYLIGIFMMGPKILGTKNHSGGARLAQRTGLPIIPVTIRGKTSCHPALIPFMVKTMASFFQRKDFVVHPAINDPKAGGLTIKELTDKLASTIESSL